MASLIAVIFSTERQKSESVSCASSNMSSYMSLKFRAFSKLVSDILLQATAPVMLSPVPPGITALDLLGFQQGTLLP